MRACREAVRACEPDVKGGAPQVVLMSSGSEVGLVMSAAEKLAAKGVQARVVSMASHELFARQSAEYRASVLPAGVPRVAIEAAHPMSWYKYIGTQGATQCMESFGASAPFEQLYKHFGFTPENIAAKAKKLVRK